MAAVGHGPALLSMEANGGSRVEPLHSNWKWRVSLLTVRRSEGRTLRDAGYCAAAHAQHGHPSDRARTAKDSHAIVGDVSTVPTFAVRPGFLGIERSNRNAAICIAGISHELRTADRPGGTFLALGRSARPAGC